MNRIIFDVYKAVLGVLFVSHCSYGAECYTPVKTCPCTKELWTQRSQNSTCSRQSEKYACVLHASDQLVEICTANFTISYGISGCPYVKRCNGRNEAEFGIQSKYKICPERITGCPRKNHEEYSIYQLYRYPACFITNRTKLENASYDNYCTKKQTKDLISRDSPPSDSVPLWIIIVAISVLVGIIVVVGIFYYRRRKKATKEGEEASTAYEEELSLLQTNEDPTQGPIQRKEFPELTEKLLKMNESEVNSCKKADPLLRGFSLPTDTYFASVILEDDVDYIVHGVRSDDDDSERIPPKNIEKPEEFFDTNLRFHFLRGDACSGKTRFCMRLLNYWCTAKKSTKSVADVKEIEWVNALGKYDFAFFVRLDNVDKTTSSVIDMICNDTDFVYDNTLHGQIREVITRDTHECLIILDGLDKWKPTGEVLTSLKTPGIPYFDSMSKNTVLICSRPNKLDEMSESIRETDRMVNILGLNDEGVKRIFDNILVHRFKESNKDLNVQYKQFRAKYTSSLASNPFLFTASVLLWHENARFGESKLHFFLSLMQYLFKITDKSKNEDIATSSVAFVSRESTEEKILPEMQKIFNDYKHLEPHIRALIRLGKFAFEDLVSKDIHLVLKEKALSEQIGDDNFQLILNVGLLSKSEARTSFARENVRITFLNRNIQELLAAIFVVSKRRSILNELTSINKILELSYLITFISGLSPDICYEISEQIAEIANRDDGINTYRATVDYEKHNIVRRMYNLLLDCYQEAAMRSKITMSKTYVITDVYLRSEDNEHYINLTKQLLTGHVRDARSLYLRYVPNANNNGIPDAVLKEFLQISTRLESVYIKSEDGDRSRSFESADIFKVETKKALLLDNVTITTETLRGLQEGITKAEQLKTLGLWNVRYGNSCPNQSSAMKNLLQSLSRVPNLTTLYLSCKTNKADRKLFIDALPAITQLQNIQYGGDKNEDEMDDLVVKTILTSHSKVLKKLWLNYLHLKNDSLDGLENMACIKKVELREVKMEENGWEKVIGNISKLQHNASFFFVGTNISDLVTHRVDLSKTLFKITYDSSNESSSNFHWGEHSIFCFKRVVS